MVDACRPPATQRPGAGVDVTLRRATAADADAISGLVRGLLHHIVADPDAPAVVAFVEALGPAATRDRIGLPRFSYVVAVRGSDLLGVAALRDRSHLYHWFVRESAHQQGIGRLLWQWIQAEADGPRITVNATLSAVPVYRRLGFEATAEVQSVDGLQFLPMAFDPDVVG
ncbi:acetyltransferase (GNAT) family protein [Lysobacter ruishenii]|uniref:Acetyltransferase (GNAT) family protein n=1 Tax=Aerolutibacter ruishenii TaxID=686800 RepID=A0A562LPK2_9GAMM|nr:acetyltransferase (GNAT) family protein [Lysobacter ruishenii]